MSQEFHHPVIRRDTTRQTASKSSKLLKKRKKSNIKLGLLVRLPCICCAFCSHPCQCSGSFIQRATDRRSQSAKHLGICKCFTISCRQLTYSFHSNSQQVGTGARKGENREVEIEPVRSDGRHIPSRMNYSFQSERINCLQHSFKSCTRM